MSFLIRGLRFSLIVCASIFGEHPLAYANTEPIDSRCAVFLTPSSDDLPHRSVDHFKFGETNFILAGDDLYSYSDSRPDELNRQIVGVQEAITDPTNGAFLSTIDHVYAINSRGAITSFEINSKYVDVLSPDKSKIPNVAGLSFDINPPIKISLLARDNYNLILITDEGLSKVQLGSTTAPKLVLRATIESELALSSSAGRVRSDLLLLNTSAGSYLVEPSGSYFGPYNIGSIKRGQLVNDITFLLSDKGTYVFRRDQGLTKFGEPVRDGFQSIFFAGYFLVNIDGEVWKWNGDLGSTPVRFSSNSYELMARNSLWIVDGKNQLLRISEGGDAVKAGTVSENPTKIYTGPTAEWLVGRSTIYRWSLTTPGKLDEFATGFDVDVDSPNFMLLRTKSSVIILSEGDDSLRISLNRNFNGGYVGGGDSVWFRSDMALTAWRASEPGKFVTFDYPSGIEKGSDFKVDGTFTDKTTLIFGSKKYRPDFNSKKMVELEDEQKSHDERPPTQMQKQAGARSEVDKVTKDPNSWVVSPVGQALIFSGTSQRLDRWNPGLEFDSVVPDNLVKGQELLIRWKFNELSCRTDRSSLQQTVAVENASTGVVEWETGKEDIKISDGGYLTVLPPIVKNGDYRVVVTAVDVFGMPASIQRSYSVGKTWIDWSKRGGSLLIATSIIAFVVLVIGSRWSNRCFDILFDPIFRRIGLWFGPAIRYIRPLRLWVLERYFVEMKNTLVTDHPYLAVRTRDQDGKVVMSDQIVGLIKNSAVTWIMGGAGVGKTELMKELARNFFSQPSLRRAWKIHRYIPVFVTVRDVGRIAATGGDWVPEVARLSLKSKGVKFDDAAYFRNLLSCGDFLVVLDGMNEANRNDDLQEFLAAERDVRIVATSQGPSPITSTYTVTIPRLSGEEALSLLEIFLGGPHHVAESSLQSLLGEVISGYDISLISQLIKQKIAVPSRRSDLYQRTLDAVALRSGDFFREDEICRLAWNLWKEGKRIFSKEAELSTDLLNILRSSQVIVSRGLNYEFRHDLMRGYLAARWLVRYSTSFDQALSRLAANEVWEVGPSDQDSLFPFLVESCKGEEQLSALLTFAIAQPTQRIRLLEALRIVAPSRGVVARVRLDD